ncbi:DNA ligase 1-like [Medicago truncatula]|uniref:DNA ligase 1-like n=1 Tax=Medicago truncatula TaxID=3880 RepID=UPI0019677083|nr:DNA ligase 1-like [Medicago truncatula]
MARTKTISKSSDNETNQVEQSQPPQPNAAADQTSDQQLLSETPVRTILQDVIIPASENPKSSKTRSSKKPIIKPRPIPTRRSTRMKKPLKKPKVSHVNLDSDEEKEDSSDDEDSEDETEEDPEEEDEDSEQTLSDAMKSVKASSKRDKELTKKILQRRKEIAAEAMPLSEEKTSEDEEESEEEESEEKAEKEEEKGSSKKHGKGKDITKLAATLKASRTEKIALRPMSRTKYFNLESLETKAWNLKEFTEPQGWTDFVTLQEHTYENLVREFYTNLSVKEKKNVNEKFLISSVKGVKIKVTQEFLSEALKIPNEATKQTSAGLPYGMHLTSIFKKANVPLEEEKRKLDFMTFSSKTLGQLHITTSNMPSSTASGTSGSVKRLSNQNVQKTRKKRKLEEIRNESSENVGARPPSPSALELFSQVSKLAKEIVKEGSSQFKVLLGEDDAQKDNDASLQEEAENAKQATEVHESIPQDAKENSLDQNQRVEENTEFDAQIVDDTTQEVAELLASNMSIDEEEVQVEHMDFSTGIDLNVEDINTDFNNEVFQDGQETAQYVQKTTEAQNVEVPPTQNVEVSEAQNVEEVQVMANQDDQAFDDQHASNEPLQSGQLSADPAPLALGSLPSVEVQLMAQTGQNVNLSSSTMGSVAEASNFLVSNLPTPNTIPSYTPPPPPMKTTNTSKLPNMSALFDSLNTFVTANREKDEPSGVAPPAKTSRAEKLASRALRVSTKTHKIVCALADWTVKVHAPGLAISPPVFDDPSIFEAEPSSDSGDSTP